MPKPPVCSKPSPWSTLLDGNRGRRQCRPLATHKETIEGFARVAACTYNSSVAAVGRVAWPQSTFALHLPHMCVWSQHRPQSTRTTTHNYRGAPHLHPQADTRKGVCYIVFMQLQRLLQTDMHSLVNLYKKRNAHGGTHTAMYTHNQPMHAHSWQKGAGTHNLTAQPHGTTMACSKSLHHTSQLHTQHTRTYAHTLKGGTTLCCCVRHRLTHNHSGALQPTLKCESHKGGHSSVTTKEDTQVREPQRW